MVTLGKEGQLLTEIYTQVLGISQEDTQKIIEKNSNARMFLQQESALRMTSYISNISILLSMTLLRENNDFSSIKTREMGFIKEQYGFGIQPLKVVEKDNDEGMLKVLKIREQLLDDEESNLYSTLKNKFIDTDKHDSIVDVKKNKKVNNQGRKRDLYKRIIAKAHSSEVALTVLDSHEKIAKGKPMLYMQKGVPIFISRVEGAQRIAKGFKMYKKARDKSNEDGMPKGRKDRFKNKIK